MGQTCKYLQESPLPHLERFHLIQMPLPLCLSTQASFHSFSLVSFLIGLVGGEFFGAAATSVLGVTGCCCVLGLGCKAVCISWRQCAISLIVSLNDQPWSLIAVVTAVHTALSAESTSWRFGARKEESTGAARASSLNLWLNFLTTIKCTSCNIAEALAINSRQCLKTHQQHWFNWAIGRHIRLGKVQEVLLVEEALEKLMILRFS